ncbi:MAG: MarR family transcriptional regulator [Alphaproteobacteria bacterium]|nr:MarR family transcriptional regulator [Alphaproteobacteria bacterium]
MTPRQFVLHTLLTEINIASHLILNRFERLAPGGLTEPQFGVLNHFARLKKPAESPSHLARAFQVSKGTMTNTLQRLEARGYVMIEPDPDDGRAKIVRPTAAGLLARDAALAEISPAFEPLFENVTTAELEAMLPLLRKLRFALDDAPDR